MSGTEQVILFVTSPLFRRYTISLILATSLLSDVAGQAGIFQRVRSSDVVKSYYAQRVDWQTLYIKWDPATSLARLGDVAEPVWPCNESSLFGRRCRTSVTKTETRLRCTKAHKEELRQWLWRPRTGEVTLTKDEYQMSIRLTNVLRL